MDDAGIDTTNDGYCTGAPELAIEIISSFNDAYDIELNVAQYLQHGAMEVWVLYPKTRHVHVFRASAAPLF